MGVVVCGHEEAGGDAQDQGLDGGDGGAHYADGDFDGGPDGDVDHGPGRVAVFHDVAEVEGADDACSYGPRFLQLGNLAGGVGDVHAAEDKHPKQTKLLPPRQPSLKNRRHRQQPNHHIRKNVYRRHGIVNRLRLQTDSSTLLMHTSLDLCKVVLRCIALERKEKDVGDGKAEDKNEHAADDAPEGFVREDAGEEEEERDLEAAEGRDVEKVAYVGHLGVLVEWHG